MRRTANRSRVGALSPRAISTKGLDILRRVRFAPYRKGHGPTFALTMWDTHRTDSRGSTTVGYRLVEHTVAGKTHVLFAGEDYHGSPMDASDSDANVRGLMEFLTLKPGDTDEEYFANYTPAQMAFAETHAETLNAELSQKFPNEQEKRERREYSNRSFTIRASVATRTGRMTFGKLPLGAHFYRLVSTNRKGVYRTAGGPYEKNGTRNYAPVNPDEPKDVWGNTATAGVPVVWVSK
jgi:hypothetical protein